MEIEHSLKKVPARVEIQALLDSAWPWLTKHQGNCCDTMSTHWKSTLWNLSFDYFPSFQGKLVTWREGKLPTRCCWLQCSAGAGSGEAVQASGSGYWEKEASGTTQDRHWISHLHTARPRHCHQASTPESGRKPFLSAPHWLSLISYQLSKEHLRRTQVHFQRAISSEFGAMFSPIMAG